MNPVLTVLGQYNALLTNARDSGSHLYSDSWLGPPAVNLTAAGAIAALNLLAVGIPILGFSAAAPVRFVRVPVSQAQTIDTSSSHAAPLPLRPLPLSRQHPHLRLQRLHPLNPWRSRLASAYPWPSSRSASLCLPSACVGAAAVPSHARARAFSTTGRGPRETTRAH
jgi:hypothetical protein